MFSKKLEKKLQDERGQQQLGTGPVHSLNALNVLEALPQCKGFNLETFKSCIRMHEWYKDDFDFEMEQLVSKYLPDWIRDVYFQLKEFRANRRNELTSVQEGFARMMGFPYETQNEKAFVVFNYAIQRYYESSEIE